MIQFSMEDAEEGDAEGEVSGSGGCVGSYYLILLTLLELHCAALTLLRYTSLLAYPHFDSVQVVHDEETGLESAVISLGAGVKKRVTLNTHAMQQKNQVTTTAATSRSRKTHF